MKISVVIPSHNSLKFIKNLLNSINKQTLKPYEVLLIDKDSNTKLKDFILDLKLNLNIKLINYNLKSFPGSKRNYGVKIAQGDIIAFLDVKTVPTKNWLYDGYNKLMAENYDVVFGSTRFHYKTIFQKILLCASFGNINHETTPGSLILKNKFYEIGKFIENVKAGDDLEWRERIKNKKLHFYTPNSHNLEYSDLPTNIFEVLYKYFISAIDNAFVEVQNKIKDLYLTIILLLSAIIIPKWNSFLPDWDQSRFYIPNITKIYIITFLIIYLFVILFNNITKQKNIIKHSIFILFFTYLSFILIFISIFYWNDRIANWIEEAVWYIPHVTKIYLFSITFISLVIRGIYFPIKRKVNIKNIFPINWIFIGMIGVSLDIIKAPGYIIGGLIMPIIKLNKLNLFKKKIK